MERDFYPFVEEGGQGAEPCAVQHPARIAVYDDASTAPRVVVIEPCDVREYLEQITASVNRLSHEQGGSVPFMVIREIVENFIHAYFQSPTITILDGGNTIRFSDQGPGIKEKALALEYGTTSATEDMKRYIRGVGSGLPYVQQYMSDKGGSLEIEDNISGGTVVTISTHPREEARAVSNADQGAPGDVAPLAQGGGWPQQGAWQTPCQAAPQQAQYPQPWPQQGWPQQAPYQQQSPYPQQTYPQPAYQQPVYQQQQPWGGSQQAAAGAYPSTQPQAPAYVDQIAPTIDERGAQVLSYLADHELVGPTDLVRTFGSSAATWSRVLSSLSAQGLVNKVGQKYQLTAVGRSFT